MVLASANSFSTLVAVRFFVGKSARYLMFRPWLRPTGLAESTFYPAIQYVIGSWYKGDELAKRACIFHVREIVSRGLCLTLKAFVDCKRHRTHVQWIPADGELASLVLPAYNIPDID